MLTPRFLILIFITQVILVNAQTLTQTVRGKVVDQVTQMALPGATVQILNTDPIIGAVTDAEGEFKIQKLPVGNYALRISFIGYKDFVLPNIIVNSGKETVLTIAIEEELL
ncbi:MAG: carboxypeptidase-like regulatory domain-containing protein, partial [Cyclobacteriaceae bacterium]|nr:carboxypeptidase-like regulatory domain-containing protein [Cyclobacteriaceae bacterium]